MKAISSAVLAASVLLAAPAWEASAAEPVKLARMTEGYSYFNRPGADMAAHDADLSACVGEAARSRSVDEMIGNGGLVGRVLTDMANNGVRAAAVENCMVVRGWRVVHLADAEGETLAALDPAALAARLEPWIGLETPHGDVVRVWDNDAAHASTDRFDIRPGRTKNGLLGVVALQRLPAVEPAPILPPETPGKMDPKWPKKPLKPNQLESGPAGSAVILVQIKGVSQRNGIGVSFLRMPPPRQSLAVTPYADPDAINALVGTLFAKKEGNFLAVAVPPGRWRLAAMGLIPQINFCMGSPSFEVAAGEIVYAGSFDMSAEALGPDLSLDAPKAWLAGQPTAERVRPAVYTNGAVGECSGNILYALEVEGAPFEPGYRWGGAAKASAPAVAPPATTVAAPAAATPAG